MIDELRRVIKRMHYPLKVMLVCVRWYAAYPLSLRHIEEMMIERGVFVDHSTVHRWALKMLPVLTAIFRQRKRPVGRSGVDLFSSLKVTVRRASNDAGAVQ
jgi:putative transposase